MTTFLPEGTKPLHELFLLWADERLATISSKRPDISAEKSQMAEWCKAEKAETDAAFLEFQLALENEEIRVFFYREDPPRRLFLTGDEIARSGSLGHIFSNEKVFAFHDDKLFRHDNERPLADEAEFQAWVTRWRERTGQKSVTHSGLAGRPSAKHLIADELERRISSGVALVTKPYDEAKALHEWLKDNHPIVNPGARKTIANNIAPRLAKARQSQRPK